MGRRAFRVTQELFLTKLGLETPRHTLIGVQFDPRYGSVTVFTDDSWEPTLLENSVPVDEPLPGVGGGNV